MKNLYTHVQRKEAKLKLNNKKALSVYSINNIRVLKNKMNKTKQKQTNKLKTKPEITKLQQKIHDHLYKFRFLNRHHLQTQLNHKSRTYIIDLLNDLTKRNYLKQYYTPKMKLAGLPAIYSLGLMGRKYLKKLRDKEGHKEYKLSQLNRVYQEYSTTMAFKIKCMSLAEIHLSLKELTQKSKAKVNFSTKVDLKGMKNLIRPEPDAYFAIEEVNKTIKRYFLEYVDVYMPQDDIEKRVRRYISYFKKETWQENTGHPFPEIILILSNNSLKTSMHGFIKDRLEEEAFVDMNFYLSTRQEIKQQGLSRQTLHKVEVK